jgi:hypothetical protein
MRSFIDFLKKLERFEFGEWVKRIRIKVPLFLVIVLFQIDHQDLVCPKSFDGVFLVDLDDVSLVVYGYWAINGVFFLRDQKARIPIVQVHDSLLTESAILPRLPEEEYGQ